MCTTQSSVELEVKRPQRILLSVKNASQASLAASTARPTCKDTHPRIRTCSGRALPLGTPTCVCWHMLGRTSPLRARPPFGRVWRTPRWRSVVLCHWLTPSPLSQGRERTLPGWSSTFTRIQHRARCARMTWLVVEGGSPDTTEFYKAILNANYRPQTSKSDRPPSEFHSHCWTFGTSAGGGTGAGSEGRWDTSVSASVRTQPPSPHESCWIRVHRCSLSGSWGMWVGICFVTLAVGTSCIPF